MSTKRYNLKPRDNTVYIGKFTGYWMAAFGTKQLLDYTAEIQVFQSQLYPPQWTALDATGKGSPDWVQSTATDVMRAVEQCFDTQLEKWQTFERDLFGGAKKLGPQLVKKIERTA
jgi:hypothetical protein